jgi:hypothetical protein
MDGFLDTRRDSGGRPDIPGRVDRDFLVDDRKVTMLHDDALTRIRAEYLELPGLRLTPAQAQRLWGVEPALCDTLLDALVDEKFLCVKPDGQYMRLLTDGEISSPQAARASLRIDTHAKAS